MIPDATSARRSFCRGQGGQSLIEVALMVPIFTILVCYAVDFGYFLLVATSLNSAARSSLEYAIPGHGVAVTVRPARCCGGFQPGDRQHRTFRSIHHHGVSSSMFERRGRNRLDQHRPMHQPQHGGRGGQARLTPTLNPPPFS